MTDGRMHRPELVALLGDDLDVRAPAVGLWRGGPRPGTVVRAGDEIGELEILGVLHRLVAPPQAVGAVVDDGRPSRAPIAVDFGAMLFRLDAIEATAAATHEAKDPATTGALVFRTPLSGRFYARPAPDKPNFVAPGDVIAVGQTVGLLEVMKTFNRIIYGGEGLPARARVTRVVPENEADLDQGDPILEIEPCSDA
jgi:acetyl-CoA carboxylase biotin carboxyl carrier protein